MCRLEIVIPGLAVRLGGQAWLERQPVGGLAPSSIQMSLLHACDPGSRGTLPCPHQAWIGRMRLESFSLTADLMYCSQNAPRIMRAIFEICLR